MKNTPGRMASFARAFFRAACLVAIALPIQGTDAAEARIGAKYIFLFVGDGMGVAQRQSAELFLAARGGLPFSENRLAMNTLPTHGMTTTYSHNRIITDSAAAGTAMASGFATENGRLGLDAALQPVTTVAERARDKGMRVGIVSSASIDHATPAAFYAKQPRRDQYHEIAHDLVASGFDYFGGGGFRDPSGSGSEQPLGCALSAAQAQGYVIVTNRPGFDSLQPGGKAIAINARLQDSLALPYSIDATQADISLAEFTAKGIALLDNPDGFFMMIEGGKIDWACHANDVVAAIHDILAFDAAIRVALEFAATRPDETLIVVTADHECGGLSIGCTGSQYESDFTLLLKQDLSFQAFGELVTEYRRDKIDNRSFEDMKPLVERHFGLTFDGRGPGALTVREQNLLREAFILSMAGVAIGERGEDASLRYGQYDPFVSTVIGTLNRKAGIGWATYNHSAVSVMTTAGGAGHDQYGGLFHLSEIGSNIMRAINESP